MPGNEVGDRVHNFFAQDNLSQGQHNSQAVDGNWPVLSNNLWPGSQRQVGILNSSSKNFNLQQSDSERGLVGNPLHGSHGLTFTQSTTRTEFAKSQSQSQQPNFNGFMYGNQLYQTRPDESNFLAVDTNSDQRNLSQRSISAYGSQQVGGSENQGKPSVRSETSGSPVGFDFFGGPQQMNHQQLSMLQSLQHQPSGLNDMQQLQILMKMQELQRQQQLQQIDPRQQSLMNSPFAKQASGTQSPSLINGSPNSDALGYQLPNDLGNPNWMQRNALTMQGSSNGLVFSPSQGLTQRMADLVPHQVEQSLYGVPISSSRGSLHQYPHMATEKPSVQQLTNTGNFLLGNQYNTFPGQVKLQDMASIARQRFLAENSSDHGSGHVSSAMNMGNVHQMNSMQRNVHIPDTSGRQEQPVPSETLQETTDTQNIPSRDDVALDPTEERILFGSDDNIWGAFGKSPNMSGEGSNLFDGAGLNGFSSIQSGSWSALMQSAVAETSSSDVGLHEEWSGLNFQNIDNTSGNQHTLSGNNVGKQHAPLADENLAMASTFGSGSVPSSGGSNINKNYQNLMGFQQFGRKFSNETNQRLPTNPSQGPDLSSAQGGRWSNGVPVRKSVAEGSQMHGNVSNSLDAESSGSRPLYNKPNGWNAFGPVTPYGDAALTLQGSDSSLQHSEGTEQKRMMQRELVDGGALWKSSPGQDSRVELEQVKSSRGSSLMNKESFGLNNAAVLSDSSANRAGEGNSQFLLNNYHLNYWKNVDPLVKSKIGEVGGGSQQDKICSSTQEGKGHEMEHSDKQENSNDSYRSNPSHHTSAGGPKENAGYDAIDSRALSTGKQKLSNQIGRKNSTSRKFQYHPMGNLDDDVEPSHGMKQPIFPPAMSHFGQSKFFGQGPKNSIEAGKGQSPDLQRSTKGFDESMSSPNFSGSISNSSAPFNKSVEMFTPDKASQSSQNMLELLHKVDQSKEHTAVMHAIASDPNAASEMLQAENCDGSVSRLQRSQSSNSQGFGLQLGPPMQRLPNANQSLSSQSSLQMGSSLQATHAISETGRKGQAQLVPPLSSCQSVPSFRERSQGENNRSGVSVQTNNETSLYKLPGNFSSAFNSAFPHSRGPLQSQEIAWASGQLSRSLDKHVPGQKDDPHERPPSSQSARTSLPEAAGSIPYGHSVSSVAQQSVNILPGKVLAQPISAGKPLPVSQPSSMSNKPLPNMWSNVPAYQHSVGSEFQKVSSQISQLNQTNVANSTSTSLNQGDQDGKRGNFSSEFGANTANSQDLHSEEEQPTKESSGQQESSENVNQVQKTKESQGKEPIVRTSSEGSPANSLSTQRDIEAFGRSLKPNNLFQQNYSLLNQMRSLKNAEDDPSNRVLKRMKGVESGLVSQLVPPLVANSNDLNAIVGDALVPRAVIPQVDPTMLNFSASENNMEANASSQHGNLAPQGVLAYSRDGPHGSNTATSSKVDHLKISPQMAPSWFNQYGNFKNGQIFPMYDARQATVVKAAEQPFTFGKSSSSLHPLNSMEPLASATVDVNRVGGNRQTTTPSLAVEYLSSQLFPSTTSGQQPVALRSKKRKSCISELDPWHKEVSQGSRRLQSISMAEVEWAKAANHLIDKVGEDVDLLEDGPPFLKPKRRIILTTQLMQLLLRPPPAAILSLDANSGYESVAYTASRLALGDACSMVFLTSSKSKTLPDGTNRLSDEGRTSERVDDQLLLKTVDDFMSRARNLENEFSRLDKRASVLDLIVESQDLEKFSVINRFAKFHGRGQADSAEAASSSDAAANTQKPYPQRYVTALPLPRNLPTKVQCCSL